MTITIDRNIYSDNCISNVIYWFSEKHIIRRSLDGDKETLFISDIDCESVFLQEFYQKLNDYKLREIIEEETKNIRTILYAKAFGEFENITEEEMTA